MPSRESMKKMAISVSDAEHDVVRYRAETLGCSVNEYMRRLIALGDIVSSLQRPVAIPNDGAVTEPGLTEPVVDVSIIATTESGRIGGRFIISDLLY